MYLELPLRIKLNVAHSFALYRCHVISGRIPWQLRILRSLAYLDFSHKNFSVGTPGSINFHLWLQLGRLISHWIPSNIIHLLPSYVLIATNGYGGWTRLTHTPTTNSCHLVPQFCISTKKQGWEYSIYAKIKKWRCVINVKLWWENIIQWHVWHYR